MFGSVLRIAECKIPGGSDSDDGGGDGNNGGGDGGTGSVRTNAAEVSDMLNAP